MTDVTRIVINGACGRMGLAVAAAARESEGVEVAAGVAPGGGAKAIPDWPGARIIRSFDELDGSFDVIVDFSSPGGLDSAVHEAVSRGTPLVSGTTGLGDDQRTALLEASKSVAVVAAPNFSVGITILFDLVERAARAVGPGADVEILEAHHRHKADAPSGTALKLGETIATVRGASLEKIACYDRRAEKGPRESGSIGFAAIRGGDIIGEHQVLFALQGERLELAHRSSDRGIFARGALRAARWIVDRPAGLYDMRDVLGL